jgi:hypothetical protein
MLMRWPIGFVLASFLSASAFAQQPAPDRRDDPGNGVLSIDTTTVLSAVQFHRGQSTTVFRMYPGGCLRGPLQFFDADGKVIFLLADGIEYPTGCGNDRVPK